jgi:hypothetical protein
MEDIIPRGDDCRDLQPLGSFPATRVLNFAFSGRGTPSRFLVETETDHQNGILQRMKVIARSGGTGAVVAIDE